MKCPRCESSIEYKLKKSKKSKMFDYYECKSCDQLFNVFKGHGDHTEDGLNKY